MGAHVLRLTGVNPYVAWSVTPQLDVWGPSVTPGASFAASLATPVRLALPLGSFHAREHSSGSPALHGCAASVAGSCCRWAVSRRIRPARERSGAPTRIPARRSTCAMREPMPTPRSTCARGS